MLTALETAAAAGLTLASAAGALAYATIHPRSQLFGRVLVGPPHVEQLALTFDDGPNPTATPRLLELLARHGARATFFLIGAHALREPGLTREILAAGHCIGNHTMTHPWLPRLSGAAIRQEIRDCNRALEDTTGEAVPLFRAPHGARTPGVLLAARELGLTTVGWNLIVGDWNPLPPDKLLARMEKGIARNRRRGEGTNLVLHDGGQHTPTAPRLPTVEAVSILLARLPGETVFVTPPEWSSSPHHLSMAE